MFDRCKATKVLGSMLNCRLTQHRMVQTFLKQITAVGKIDIFGFLAPGEISRSTRRLQRLYREHWLVLIKGITGLSVQATNDLCDHLKDPMLLGPACALYLSI